jgi:hypothetical protein
MEQAANAETELNKANLAPFILLVYLLSAFLIPSATPILALQATT